ncbi:MAG: hypothetical protein P8L45_03490, partial [Longimicrobiales bacterium]|nr:hypothetical protein [Longimicrobiales bacterium]
MITESITMKSISAHLASDRFVIAVRSLVAIAVFVLASCGGGVATGPTAGSPSFDGAAALAHVETQVAFGPRIPGSSGHAAQLSWMLDQLQPHASDV